MKKLIYFYTLLFSFYGSSQLQYIGNPSFSSGQTMGAEIAIDQVNSIPYVGYLDENESGDVNLFVRKLDGNSWEPVGSNPLNNQELGYSSRIKFDINPITLEPFVVFIEGDSTVIQKFNGSNWVQVGNKIKTLNFRFVNLTFHPLTGQTFIAVHTSLDSNYPGLLSGIYKYGAGNWENVYDFGMSKYRINMNFIDGDSMIVTSNIGTDLSSGSYSFKLNLNDGNEQLIPESIVHQDQLNMLAWSSYGESSSSFFIDNKFYSTKHFNIDPSFGSTAFHSTAVEMYENGMWSVLGGYQSDIDNSIFASSFNPKLYLSSNQPTALFYHKLGLENRYIRKYENGMWQTLLSDQNFPGADILSNTSNYRNFTFDETNLKPIILIAESDSTLSVLSSIDPLNSINNSEIKVSGLEDIKLYPNPNNGNFKISLNNRIETLIILNISGQIIFEKEVFEIETYESNLQLVKGIYYVCLKDRHGYISTKKFVIN